MIQSDDRHAGGFVRPDPRTIPEAFARAVSRYQSRTALRYRDGNGAYTGIAYEELDRLTDRLASALRRLGIEPGDRVAIIAYHGPKWVIADLAVLKLGAVVVPIYHTLSPPAMRYILSDAGCRLVFVETEALRDSVESVREGLPALDHVVLFEKDRDGGGCAGIDDLLDAAAGEDRPGYPAVSPDDTATIVYTSGTTGEPKGVVLTHGNIVSNALALARRFRGGPDDVFLSFLPLCHMFERTCGYYASLFSGVTIAIAGSLATIVEDVQAIKPTMLITVPRLLEKIYEAVECGVLRSSPFRRRLVQGAIRSLNERVNLEYRGEPVPFRLRALCAFYDRAVAAKFRRIAGGRLRVLVSGGAALDRRLAKTMLVLGFNVCEGYGLTETSPVVASATLEENRLGTVGRPLEGVEVMIGENDEILVRGPNVMKGYHNRPEETARAIDPVGWFHTGDRGRFDGRGNLSITGRIKEIIVTSYGKNVAPAPIESAIAKSPYIDQVVLCGDGRRFIAALIVPARCAIEEYAKGRGIVAHGYEELLAREEIRALIASEIEEATADAARFEKVRRFALIAEPFTVANRLLTPTMKLRRAKVIEAYGDLIEQIYREPCRES
ncbi:MAG: long-chain fatty acid--CoA ligase [Candidatus Krumholzibacteria bacterium]|nr:long-chain fatty acid--CoA ligase [Candidatus Krumholzibacteria bacterium]